jgi:hypothetical protein
MIGALAENGWLHEGVAQNEHGEHLDIVDALLDRRVLGSLPHMHRDGKLFAIVKVAAHIRNLIVLNRGLKVQLDVTPGGIMPIRIFCDGIGMLLFSGGVRYLVTYDGFGPA